MAPHQEPYVLAMLICDAIWKDPSTGKSFLLGTFSSIAAMEFPVVHPVMGVYIVLTDGRGKIPLKLQLVSADEDDIIAGVETDVLFEDPRAVLELTLHLQNATFPGPGEYRLQLFSGSTPLMERRLVLVKLERAEGHE